MVIDNVGSFYFFLICLCTIFLFSGVLIGLRMARKELTKIYADYEDSLLRFKKAVEEQIGEIPEK